MLKEFLRNDPLTYHISDNSVCACIFIRLILGNTFTQNFIVIIIFTFMQGQAPHKTLNALDLMRTLESETTSESNSAQHLEPVKEDDIDNDTLTVPDRSSSPSKQNRQPRDATTPTKKKVRGRAMSTSTLSLGAGSGNLKNHSITSIGNGRHSVHTSGYSSHNSHHPSNSSGGGSGSGSGTVRTRTVSVGSKPVSSSTASQRRPNSGHTSHREKRHSTPSQTRT